MIRRWDGRAGPWEPEQAIRGYPHTISLSVFCLSSSLHRRRRRLAMSFVAALRVSTRRAAFNAAPRARATPVRSAFRKYSTTPPPPEAKSSNTMLFVGVGLAALTGAGYYVYASSSDSAREASTALKSAAQAGKAITKFVPSKDDYQKVRHLTCLLALGRHLMRCFNQVYNKIAAILEDDSDYDGQF